MDCRLKYATEISDDIKQIAGVGRTSAKAVKANQILLPVGGKDGENKSLATIQNTYEWAKQIKAEVDRKYNARAFGSLVHLDSTTYNGTLLNIVITSKILDAYEAKNGQKPMYQLDTVNKKNELIDNANALFNDYAMANGIKLEFVDSLIDEYNNDPIAIYDSINKVIKINKKEADVTTLPEELAHHLTLALGKDHILVNRALNLIGRIDYKSALGQSYVDAYNGDTYLLKQEYLGKLISAYLVNNKPEELISENGNKIWETIKRMVDYFVSLFKPVNNVQSDLDSIVSELGNMIKSGKKIEGDINYHKLFQLNNKDIDSSIKDQYVYFRHQVKKLKTINKRLRSETNESNKDINNKLIEANKEKILKIESSLSELLESGNKQLLVNLANDTLDLIEKYISDINEKKNKGLEVNYNNIDNTVKTLNILSTLKGVQDRVTGLQEDLKPHIKDFALQHVNKYSSSKIEDIDLKKHEKDIFIGEANFGTLSDVNNHLARTIGFLIKDAQAAIERDNKKSFNELEEQIKSLDKYISKAGISEKNKFDVFIQEYKNTTILTREYTTEFYNKISDSYKMEEDEGLTYRKSIATYDFENKEWKPKDDKYINKNYEKIKNTPELKKFYDYFKSVIAKASEDFPVGVSENFIPNIAEDSLMNILKSDADLMSKLKEGVQHITDIYDIDEKESSFIKDEHLFGDTIPLKYIAKMSPDKKSKDLGTALLKFMYFSNSYKHMNEILPKTRLLQEMIKEQAFVKNTNSNVGIKGEETNLYKMTKAFIDMQVKGEMKKDEKYAPYIDFGLKYTSLLRIGLNPFNALTNIIVGNIGNIIESVGGRFFTYSEYNEARKIFFEESTKSDSKLDKLIERYNPLMELEDYENLNKIAIGNTQNKEKIKSLMYMPQRIGEKYLQTSTMIASMLHDKVTTKDGNKISMWEAFDEKGEWREDIIGYPLTDDMVFKTTNKIQRINQMIHGRYSSKDAASLQQYALFRMAFQFKKWIPAAIESRLGEKRFDERLGMEVEGRYRTIMKGFNLMLGKLQNDLEKIESNKFTETDIYNMKKNVTEVTIALATWMMYLALGWDEDKKRKKSGIYKFTMGQLDKVSGDLLFWYNPEQINNTAMNVVPLLKTHRDLIKIVHNVPYIFGGEGSEYKKGMRKGENKFISSVIDVTPIAKPLVDLIRTANDEPYQEPKKY